MYYLLFPPNLKSNLKFENESQEILQEKKYKQQFSFQLCYAKSQTCLLNLGKFWKQFWDL